MTSKRDSLPSIQTEVENITSRRPTVKIFQDKASYSQAIGRLQEYKALPRKMRPVMEEIANYVRKSMITSTFDKEGPGWKPLAKRTQSERAAAGFDPQHPILNRTGDLMKELTQKSHPHHVEVIVVGKYARVEIGGSSKKFIENQMGDRGRRLPQRAMIPGTGNIPVTERDKSAIHDIIKRTLKTRR